MFQWKWRNFISRSKGFLVCKWTRWLRSPINHKVSHYVLVTRITTAHFFIVAIIGLKEFLSNFNTHCTTNGDKSNILCGFNRFPCTSLSIEAFVPWAMTNSILLQNNFKWSQELILIACAIFIIYHSKTCVGWAGVGRQLHIITMQISLPRITNPFKGVNRL